MRGFYGWMGALLSLLAACVTEYEPKGLDQVRGLLVVDGIITNGETTIRLGRSVGLTDEFTEEEFVNNARVTVEREDGAVYACVNTSDKGEYKVRMEELDRGSRYRLRISLDGLEYESDYLSPVITPPIDSISLRKKGPGEEVRLCVSTHNTSDQSSYYRWMYKENWEVKAEIFMQAEKINNTVVIYDLQTSNNLHYCWGKDSSKVISLGSSDRLTENVIANKSLVSYLPSDRRFSMLYHVEVEQYALHREAYDYYLNLQKNIEDSGSLFAPIPSEMKGNIRCVTNPEIPVIGFVEVATVTRLKRFLPEIKEVYEAEVTGCASTIVQGIEYRNNPDYGYISYNPSNPESDTYALKRCMDCTRFGSKQKPSWWPSDHL